MKYKWTKGIAHEKAQQKSTIKETKNHMKKTSKSKYQINAVRT